jgi:hypothetical protein
MSVSYNIHRAITHYLLASIGIKIAETPFVFWENGQGRIADQLRAAGSACAAATKAGPNLIVVILPEGGNDIYTAVKQYVPLHYHVNFFLLISYFVSFGDITVRIFSYTLATRLMLD